MAKDKLYGKTLRVEFYEHLRQEIRFDSLEALRAQIQAVYDAGYEEWILWNAANRYTEGGLLPEEEN